jgi:hypothetical protein
VKAEAKFKEINGAYQELSRPHVSAGAPIAAVCRDRANVT